MKLQEVLLRASAGKIKGGGRRGVDGDQLAADASMAEATGRARPQGLAGLGAVHERRRVPKAKANRF